MNTEFFHHSWHKHLGQEFEKPYMQRIYEHLDKSIADGLSVFPSRENIFNALNLTPLNEVKVVILGQDPYHGDGQAHGLSFSVMPGIKTPPSLKNIYKEINRDLGTEIPANGDLTRWAKQGVLLINTALTVEKSKPGSHSKIGWKIFTDKLIEVVNNHCDNVVFMLWGNPAQAKIEMVTAQGHLVLTSSHPSGLSAYKGFNGCGHFGLANEFLKENGISPINW